MSYYQLYDSVRNTVFEYKMEKEDEIARNLVINNDYIDWLNEFTIINGDFYQTDWNFDNKRLPKQELENVKKLKIFYRAIELFASEKNIFPVNEKFFSYYKVKYDTNLFYVGKIKSKSDFYCKRQSLDDGTYLDIEDVIKEAKCMKKEK